MEHVDLDQPEFIVYTSNVVKNIKNELINRDRIIIREEEGYYWKSGSFPEFSASANGDPVAKSFLARVGLAAVRATFHPLKF
jgi:hypothetical protein